MNVILFENNPREQTHRLLEICNEINDSGLRVLSEIVSILPGKYPRYPRPISVSKNALRCQVVDVLRYAELVSDDGLEQMINKALWVMDLSSGMYLCRRKNNSVIVNLHQT